MVVKEKDKCKDKHLGGKKRLTVKQQQQKFCTKTWGAVFYTSHSQ